MRVQNEEVSKEVLQVVEAMPIQELPKCPVCACLIEEEPVTCSRCETPHHKECWDYAGGCAIFGCDSRGWRTQPVDLVAFDSMLARARQWSRLFRYQWVAFAIAAVAIVLTLCGSFLPHSVYWPLARISLIAKILTYIGKPMMAIGAIFCQLAVVAYLALLIPAWLTKKQLEEGLGESLSPPRDGGRVLMDRVHMPPIARLLKWTLGGTTAFAILMAFCLTWVNYIAPSGAGIAAGFTDIVTLCCMGILFPLGAFIASRLRLTYVQTVQNRVQASIKGRALLGTSVGE